jgi:hypothetical protein
MKTLLRWFVAGFVFAAFMACANDITTPGDTITQYSCSGASIDESCGPAVNDGFCFEREEYTQYHAADGWTVTDFTDGRRSHSVPGVGYYLRYADGRHVFVTDAGQGDEMTARAADWHDAYAAAAIEIAAEQGCRLPGFSL